MIVVVMVMMSKLVVMVMGMVDAEGGDGNDDNVMVTIGW